MIGYVNFSHFHRRTPEYEADSLTIASKAIQMRHKGKLMIQQDRPTVVTGCRAVGLDENGNLIAKLS